MIVSKIDDYGNLIAVEQEVSIKGSARPGSLEAAAARPIHQRVGHASNAPNCLSAS
jgi:hypothetical protein